MFVSTFTELIRPYYDDVVFTQSVSVLSAITVITFIISVVSDNFSIIDRIWSLLPPFYTWFFAISVFYAHYNPLTDGSAMDAFINYLTSHPKLAMLCIGSVLWGARLSYNFARKGGYAWGAEDYRWPHVRSRINNEFLFQCLNVVFISGFQNILLFLLALPAYHVAVEAAKAPHVPLRVWDVIVGLLWVAMLLVETVADEQQWRFYGQRAKWRKQRGIEVGPAGVVKYTPKAAAAGAARPQGASDEKADERGASVRARKNKPAQQAASGRNSGNNSESEIPDPTGDLARGFSTHGLFAWSRHPNYAAEIAMWWLFALVALGPEIGNPECIIPESASGHWYSAVEKLLFPCKNHPPVIILGALLLNILFVASSLFSESITLSKYPAYGLYQEAVARFVPSLGTKRPKFLA